VSDRTKLPRGTRKAPARKFPPWARKEIEDAIERLLALLDQADGDPDLEPSLGSPNPRYLYEGGPITSQERWAEGSRNDIEDEHDGAEPPEDDEPTLGWTECGSGRFSTGVDEEEDSLGSTNSIDQTKWSAGAGGDYEQEHDGREPDEDFERQDGV
jgi:hypothetical protein